MACELHISKLFKLSLSIFPPHYLRIMTVSKFPFFVQDKESRAYFVLLGSYDLSLLFVTSVLTVTQAMLQASSCVDYAGSINSDLYTCHFPYLITVPEAIRAAPHACLYVF
jgi:hypothetical protein